MKSAIVLFSESGHLADESFALYLDKELNKPQRREFCSHLSRCPNCMDELNNLRRHDQFKKTHKWMLE